MAKAETRKYSPIEESPEAVQLREGILQSVIRYYELVHSQKPFVPGETWIQTGGRVFGAEEIQNVVEASLEFFLTEGGWADEFNRKFSQMLGVRHSILVNSGSSANLAAFASLTSPKLGERRIKPGDEVIVAASGFATTVTPIIQHGAIPVFVDVDLETLNAKSKLVAEAVTSKTKAVFLAHTLGNPFNIESISQIAKEHSLFMIEDACDALSSTYKDRLVGTFGHLGTFSFYPPHHITMGEGGAVVTNSPKQEKIIRSFRDWGRDCWCPTGCDNTCGKRFEWNFAGLPEGWDHKFTYTHAGYNLKLTDLQAAIGVAQLERLSLFAETRKRNFELLKRGLEKYEDRLMFVKPTPNSEPSWFAFPITVRDTANFTRNELAEFLESKKISTRMANFGNLTRQPFMRLYEHRIVGLLENSDNILNNSFWIGVYPGITDDMIEYTIDTFNKFFAKK